MVLPGTPREKDKRYIILSGYKVCNNQQTNWHGFNNTYNQQYWLLHQKGHCNPDPWPQFIDDLVLSINKWRAQQKEVLICIDANENPQKQSTQGIICIFTETNLIDLHTNQHPNQNWPPTYNHGTTPIDLCAGSVKFVTAPDSMWYLPFGLPVGLKGNYCTLGLDFNMEILFNQHIAPMHKVPTHSQKQWHETCQNILQKCS